MTTTSKTPTAPTAKSLKLSATMIAYLRYLNGECERPANIAIGNVQNALRKRDLLDLVIRENHSRYYVPNALALEILKSL